MVGTRRLLTGRRVENTPLFEGAKENASFVDDDDDEVSRVQATYGPLIDVRRLLLLLLISGCFVPLRVNNKRFSFITRRILVLV